MSLPEKPITRKEAYLAKIAGQDVPVPEWPLTREESYLAKIAGQKVSIPDKPITRVESYFAKIAGQTVTTPSFPITREEAYLAKMAGEDVDYPDKPITREESYFDEIINGGGEVVIVTKPTVSGDSFTYNGTAQGPTVTWESDMDQYCTVTDATKTNAGSYTLTIALKNTKTMKWDDESTSPITYAYTIAKADAVVTVNPSSVSLNPSTTTATVAVSWTGDGTASVASSDDTVASVSPASLSEAGNITITGGNSSGTAAITVSVAATTNYNAAAGSVSAQNQTIVLKTFSEATEEELVAMVQAADEGLIDLYEDAGWRVGQEREVEIESIAKTGTYDGVSWSVGNAQSSFTATLVLMARGDSNYSLVTPVLDKRGNQRTIPSFIVGFKDLFPAKETMNTGGSDSFGWNYCHLRDWCNGGVRKAFRFTTILPIFKKHKVYRVNASSAAIMPGWTEDYFSLPTEYEVTGTRTYSHEGEASNTTHFEWYQNSSNRIKKRYNSSMGVWLPDSYWTRSIKPYDRTYSVYIDTSSVSQYSSYEFEQCVSPFGCV